MLPLSGMFLKTINLYKYVLTKNIDNNIKHIIKDTGALKPETKK